MPEPSLYAVLAAARGTLAGEGVGSPEVDAVELAAHLLGIDSAEVRLRAALRTPVDPGFAEPYAALVAERARRVPLQHLTGRAHFRRVTLHVGPGVFIPRPETEVVAGLAIDAARAAVAAGVAVPVVADLCSGSGAIAFAVKDEVPAARVHAVEISDLAHAWALRNRESLGLEVDLVLGDALTSLVELAGGVDVVVSNPPYIPAGQVPLDPEVRDHDPELALYGGSADGLSIPRLVAARAAALLRPGGVLLMEHADRQGPGLQRALAASGDWSELTDHEDLTGRPRVVRACRAPG